MYLFFILSTYFVFVTCDCFWNSRSQYKMFSSKVPYELVRGDLRDSSKALGLQQCEPISVWGVYRHGKRYPGKNFAKDMKQIIDLRDSIIDSYDSGRSSLCAQDIENLINWEVDEGMFTDQHGLTPEGKLEMFNIGKRVRSVYKKLLNKLRLQEYRIRPVYGRWIRDSAKSFIKGLGHSNLNIEHTSIQAREDDMAPYTMCGKYVRDVKKNVSITYAVPEKYKTHPEYVEAKERTKERLGLNYTLTDKNFAAIFDLCRYTWDGISQRPSPWCALLTETDVKVMEYIGDMRHYYRNAYGSKMSPYFGGFPLRNLFHSMQNVVNGSDTKEKGLKLAAYFTHASMMDMIYTALGVFKDKEPLNDTERREDRLWRSTELAPFSANLIVVLYRCNGSDLPKDHKVVFYRNEKPFKEICDGGVCTWKQFVTRFEVFANSTEDLCDFWVKP